MKHIERIGVELEGGWDKNFLIEKNLKLIHDGSVGELKDGLGELRSKPLTLRGVSEFISTHYPSFVSPKCGFHIHISVTTMAKYEDLITYKFYRFLSKRLYLFLQTLEGADYTVLEDRLGGNNHYCKKLNGLEFAETVTNQLLASSHVQYRYYAINYCYRQHNTVEFRILPMFQQGETAIKALNVIVNTVNAYLDKCYKPDAVIAYHSTKRKTKNVRNHSRSI